MAKRKMSSKQRAALARGRKKQANRRKAKGQGQFCKVMRKGDKSTTRCFKTEKAMWQSIPSVMGKASSKKFDAITIYKRKNG